MTFHFLELEPSANKIFCSTSCRNRNAQDLLLQSCFLMLQSCFLLLLDFLQEKKFHPGESIKSNGLHRALLPPVWDLSGSKGKFTVIFQTIHKNANYLLSVSFTVQFVWPQTFWHYSLSMTFCDSHSKGLPSCCSLGKIKKSDHFFKKWAYVHTRQVSILRTSCIIKTSNTRFDGLCNF